MKETAISAPESLEQTRLEIAVATRVLNGEGILGYSGHVSCRTREPSGFLIQPVHVSRAALNPEQILCCDFDGNMIQAPEDFRPPSEVFIHTEIYRTRPDVNAIAHFHPEFATVFTLAEGVELRPMKGHATRWASGIPVYSDPGHVNSPALGRQLADTLGNCNAALMRAHGVVVVAESVPAVMVDAIHFEENAVAAFRAAQIGQAKPLTAAEIEAFASRFKRDRHVRKLWAYYVGRGFLAGTLPTIWETHLS
jgi:ribulose-5-phosphate 4-epimerase/fuculose-1-phosphate aldolase